MARRLAPLAVDHDDEFDTFGHLADDDLFTDLYPLYSADRLLSVRRGFQAERLG